VCGCVCVFVGVRLCVPAYPAGACTHARSRRQAYPALREYTRAAGLAHAEVMEIYNLTRRELRYVAFLRPVQSALAGTLPPPPPPATPLHGDTTVASGSETGVKSVEEGEGSTKTKSNAKEQENGAEETGGEGGRTVDNSADERQRRGDARRGSPLLPAQPLEDLPPAPATSQRETEGGSSGEGQGDGASSPANAEKSGGPKGESLRSDAGEVLAAAGHGVRGAVQDSSLPAGPTDDDDNDDDKEGKESAKNPIRSSDGAAAAAEETKQSEQEMAASGTETAEGGACPASGCAGDGGAGVSDGAEEEEEEEDQGL
jgi:hypothetical protein